MKALNYILFGILLLVLLFSLHLYTFSFLIKREAIVKSL